MPTILDQPSPVEVYIRGEAVELRQDDQSIMLTKRNAGALRAMLQVVEHHWRSEG
jgi:hypothetical protein